MSRRDWHLKASKARTEQPPWRPSDKDFLLYPHAIPRQRARPEPGPFPDVRGRRRAIDQFIPLAGEDWPLAGTHRGHTGLAATLRKASEEVEMTYPKPPEFVAQGDRVLAIGVATGKIKATNKTFRDDWVFDITVRKGKLTKIREYIDTQALAVPPRRPLTPGINPSEIGGYR